MNGKRNSAIRILVLMLSVTVAVSAVVAVPVYAASKPSRVKGLKMTDRTASSISVKWKKASKAKKYQIGYRISGGEWKYKTVRSGVRKKKLTRLKSYKKYYIKVRAVRGKKKGKWSSTISTYTEPKTFRWPDLPNIADLKIKKTGYGSIKLGWKIDEASEGGSNDECVFNVYRSTDKKKWSPVGEHLANTKRSFTCRQCDAGKKYYFRVVAIDTTSYRTFTHKGKYSEVISGETQLPDGLVIRKSFTKRNKAYKEAEPLDVKGLMVHSVGEPVQSARDWVERFDQKGYDAAAVHAFVDGSTGEVWWTMPWDMVSWHAGRPANQKYIGVEMCESAYIKYTGSTKFTIKDKYREKAEKSAETTYENTVKLFAYLCDYYGIDPNGTFRIKNSRNKTVKVHRITSHDEWRNKGFAGHSDPEHYWKGLGLKKNMNMDDFRADVSDILYKEDR